MTILIGNLIALIGASLMVGIGFIKSKKKILGAQCVQFGVQSLSNLVLGGYSGFISNVIGLLRNLVCLRREFTWPWKLAFMFIQAFLSIYTNHVGWLGYLPLLATCTFTLVMDTKNDVLLKSVITIGLIFWLIYDLAFHNYVAAVFDVLATLSNLVGIVRILRDGRKA